MTKRTEEDRRNAQRRATLLGAKLRIGLDDIPCQIMDLSLNGAKLRLDTLPEIGANVTLQIPHLGTLKAEVVWAKYGKAGLQFTMTEADVVFWLGDRAEIFGLNERKKEE